MKHSRKARTIAPFRTSGHNPRPTAAGAPLTPAQPVVRRVDPQNVVRPQTAAQKVAGAEAVTLAPPSVRASDGAPAVVVRVGGAPWRMPMGWQYARVDADGRPILYACGPARRIVILTRAQSGAVVEMIGVDLDTIDRIRRAYFA